jgi:hypothetical protein
MNPCLALVGTYVRMTIQKRVELDRAGEMLGKWHKIPVRHEA